MVNHSSSQYLLDQGELHQDLQPSTAQLGIGLDLGHLLAALQIIGSWLLLEADQR